MNVSLGEVAPAGVRGQRAVGPQQVPFLDEAPAPALLAEAEVLDGHEHLAGKVLVELGNVDVGGADAGAFVDLAGHVGEARSRPEVVGPGHSVRAVAFAHALRRAGDVDRRTPRALDALHARHHHGAGAVAFLAAIVEPVGVGDEARGLVVVDGDRAPMHHGPGVALGVGVGRDGDRAELAARGAELVHVAAGLQSIAHHRGEHAEGRGELLPSADGRSAPNAHVDAGAGASLQRSLAPGAVADHDLRGLAVDRHRGVVDDAAGGVTAAGVEVGEAQMRDAERLCHGGRLALLHGVGGEAVDVPHGEAGVFDRLEHRLAGQRELRTLRLPPLRVLRFAEAGDARLAPRRPRHGAASLLPLAGPSSSRMERTPLGRHRIAVPTPGAGRGLGLR